MTLHDDLYREVVYFREKYAEASRLWAEKRATATTIVDRYAADFLLVAYTDLAAREAALATLGYSGVCAVESAQLLRRPVPFFGPGVAP